ncbi:HAD family hydrolase [Thalassoglobus polymorphus]|uniref:phosphoglycolate phosphatase n=1 Tax=Thalassoglobus polymorphus TaxID=2527994 RepID=A0A517QLP7_9PLAN|nr:HAD family hydrolase [Thalassoglobus polymorphus]QDT32457.1 Pyrophosphatase PpaX [Thalassoglobus polymorphus]
MMSTVCLFDIDGTLLNSGGAGQHAMEQALLDVFGVTGPYEDIRAAGRTDKAITTDLFNHHKIELSEENWNSFLESYVAHLPNSLATQKGSVLPGIVDILNRLSEDESVSLGLLTGNLRVGADVKLQHYKLDHHFKFGGFGDVHHDRDDVARFALQEAIRHLDCDVPGETVWVIGDTPSDVTCGRAIGARTIAVATGIYDAKVLKDAKPDYLFDDFSDVTTVVDCLMGLANSAE